MGTFLRPGGALYLAELHPVAAVFEDAPGSGLPVWSEPYFARAAFTYEQEQDYANAEVLLRNKRQVNWIHPVSDVLGGLRAAGMQLDWLREHGRLPWRGYAMLARDGEGLWTWPERPWLPLAYSLRAFRTAP